MIGLFLPPLLPPLERGLCLGSLGVVEVVPVPGVGDVAVGANEDGGGPIRGGVGRWKLARDDDVDGASVGIDSGGEGLGGGFGAGLEDDEDEARRSALTICSGDEVQGARRRPFFRVVDVEVGQSRAGPEDRHVGRGPLGMACLLEGLPRGVDGRRPVAKAEVHFGKEEGQLASSTEEIPEPRNASSTREAKGGRGRCSKEGRRCSGARGGVDEREPCGEGVEAGPRRHPEGLRREEASLPVVDGDGDARRGARPSLALVGFTQPRASFFVFVRSGRSVASTLQVRVLFLGFVVIIILGVEDESEFPGEVVGVLDGGVEAEAAGGWHFVGGVADEEDAVTAIDEGGVDAGSHGPRACRADREVRGGLVKDGPDGLRGAAGGRDVGVVEGREHRKLERKVSNLQIVGDDDAGPGPPTREHEVEHRRPLQ
mmetsp:Transcript_467/g.1683  ORF Transcript_467/g.1683 Transcript_467/m.1683 type:complete len:428 (-) Transcript_467:768-2051(-)